MHTAAMHIIPRSLHHEQVISGASMLAYLLADSKRTSLPPRNMCRAWSWEAECRFSNVQFSIPGDS